MGGAYPGDGFADALFLNPGNGNHWITLRLAGVRSNRSAIGARVTRARAHRGRRARRSSALVGSGGSFGASTLQQEMGLGRATAIEVGHGALARRPRRETFAGVQMDAVTVLREGSGRPERRR